jgi:hypothetical protein
LLALKLPNVPDRQIIREAIHHASQYLHSHVCRGGGWNHGAAYVLQVYAPPYTLTTAEALLALQDEPHSAVIETALKFIAADNPDANSTLPLAWSILSVIKKRMAASVQTTWLQHWQYLHCLRRAKTTMY